MIARGLNTAAVVGLLWGIAAPAVAAPAPSPTPAVHTLVTDACPHRVATPPAVDASEVPAPGQRPPAPLPVVTPPIGGDRLGACGLVVPPGALPVPVGIDSAGWLVADLTDGTVLAAKDPHGRYRPASTIKLLLAQVALRELNPDTVVEGTAEDSAQEGDAAGVSPGGRYTVRQLLEGLLLISGNDAAHALARQLGGVSATVQKMNSLAAELGAHDTRATTPSGLDAPGQSTSPYDLALILRAALSDNRFVELARTRETVFPGHPPIPTSAEATRADAPPLASAPLPSSPAPTSVAPYPLYNENRLLADLPGAVAGKTGYTDDAKKTFAGAVDHSGHRYVVVQMFGLAYTGNTYWDQFRRLFDYGVGLRGRAVGTLVGPSAGTEGAHPAPAQSASADEASSATSGTSGLGTGLRWAIGGGGVVLVGILVAAALRTSRGR